MSDDNDIYSSPFWIVAIAAIVIAFFTFLTGTKYMVGPEAPKQPDCFEAPEVVGGWHTVTGRPDDGYVCGWHQVGVPEPVYRCVRMKACP